MSWRRAGRPFRWIGLVLALVILSSILLTSYAGGSLPWLDRRPLRERYEFSRVVRTDLAPILNAPGRLESSKRTTIRCQLENIAGGGAGGGASTMLWVVPEGTVVKEGDVLAKLDAANYEEMQRQQVITVEQAKATCLQAQLSYEIALLAVNEYRDGIVEETLKGMEGSIALARSDLSRTAEHLDWTERMSKKGYTSVAQIQTERHSLSLMQFALERQLMAMSLYQKFSQPKTEKTLQRQVTATRATLANEKLKLQRQVDRLAAIDKQVAFCTIRAPHEGVLYYVKNGDRRRGQNAIEEGMAVRQKQELFYLPDLSELEVHMALNESVVNRVRPGFRAKVRFEALPEVEVEGEVVTINQMPASQAADGEDIRYFISRVKLDGSAPGLTPGMTARVDILLARRPNVLAIPLEAVKLFRGKRICFVAHDESLQQRQVKIGEETTDLIEITDGLEEGEMVVLNPPFSSGQLESSMDFAESAADRTANTTALASAQHGRDSP
jgi:HlyD family secretion protein